VACSRDHGRSLLHIINFIRVLCNNNRHAVLPWLRTGFFIYVNSGLKQDCPLSALLFSLCLAPFVHRLNMIVPNPAGVVCTYLDDISIVIPDLHLNLHRILVLYFFFTRISQLFLSPSKCVLVPLFDSVLDVFKILITVTPPLAAQFQVDYCTRYLVPWLGIGGSDASWSLPLARYSQAVDSIVSHGLGMASSLYAYNYRGLPRLGYIAGFHDPPPAALRAETNAFQRLLPSPYRAITADIPYVQATKLMNLSIATKTRIALRTSLKFDACLHSFSNISTFVGQLPT
jgi:hypothetical protein